MMLKNKDWLHKRVRLEVRDTFNRRHEGCRGKQVGVNK